MKLNAYILLFLLLFTSFSNAQNAISVFGNLHDSKTNEPVDYANVTCLKSDSTFLKGSMSDSLGYFKLDMEGAPKQEYYILQITHLNYEKKFVNIRLSDNCGHTIKLEPNSNSLSEVLVLGTQTKVKNKLNVEYKVTDRLREKSLRASQLLENIPTVFVDYNQNVYIKGSSRILILRNGVELPSNSLVDQIPPSSIQKVEIMYSIPSKYANKNYTAIMNIVTKREQNMTLLLDNNSSFDGKMYDAKANFSVDTRKHSIYAFYKLYYRNFLEKYSIRSNDESAQEDSTLFFRTKPRKESDNEFFYGYSFQPNKKITIGADGYLSLYRENFNSVYGNAARDRYADFKESFNTQNYKGYVNYQDSLNKFQGVLGYNHIKVNDNSTYFYDNDRLAAQQESRETYNVQLDYKRKFSQRVSLEAGAEYAHVSNNELFYAPGSPNSTDENYNGNTLSGYVESTIEFNDKWNMAAGVNLHNYKRSFEHDIHTQAFNFYPKLNISYAINELNTLKWSYSSYINNPSLWQMLSFTKEDSPGLLYKGNPYLKPEKHSTLSMEYSYSKGDFYYAHSVYLKEARNKIQNVIYPEADYSLEGYVNLNKRRDYGTDFTLSWGLAKWWSINGYMDLTYRNIPDNAYYKNNLFSYSGQIQSSWGLLPKLSLTVQYMHNSKELVYNGYSKSYNSSLIVLSYDLLDNLSLYFLAIEPLAKFESYSKLFSADGFIERRNNIKTRTYLVSFTYNLFKHKSRSKRAVYDNADRKY